MLNVLFAKLWRGELGLAKTFWGFAVLGKMLVALVGIAVDEFTDSRRVKAWFAFGELGYGFLVAVAVFRASRHFAGRKAWAWLTLAVNTFVRLAVVVVAFQRSIG